MTTGEILAQLRKEKGIGQKELATYLKVSVGSISNYEHNVHSPDLDTLCKLADYFSVTTDYLLCRTTYRHDLKNLNRRISKTYTVSDLIDISMNFTPRSIDRLMDYASYLKDRQENALYKKPENHKKNV